MVDFDNLTFNDGLFMILTAFVVTIVAVPFLPLSNLTIDTNIGYIFEVYIIIFIVVLLGYSFLKDNNSNNYLITQEQFFRVFVIIILSIVIYFSLREIFAQRRKQHGFLLFIICVAFAIIILFSMLSFNTMSQQYNSINTTFNNLR